ncbi:MAG TPA: branched-chain amino acid aminotransferase [Ignavibacteriaceae bacterium]|nr:branched-chain amino acid aminotransferase [Ignavibacteriaceae bacterium]
MQKINYIIKERFEEIVFPKNLGFGLTFTDHCFEMDYNPVDGWHNPTIKPLEKLELHPATMFIHYGQAIFEGLKAFKQVNGDIVIFRPDRHFQRLNNSARRLCMPEVDIDFMTNALVELIQIEKDWVPTKRGEALYIRPFLFGVDPILGVKPSTTYKLIIILSPVGAYYPEGFKPVKILATDEYVRAVRKGIGECKTPANYAASLLASEEARKIGFTQVLWMDGVEQKYIEEVGTMNIFVQFKDEIATPKLNGSILPGVTRASVIHILKEEGYNINERLIAMEEVISEYKKGNVVGIFGSGTAAIISAIGVLRYKDFEMTFDYSSPDCLTIKLFEKLTSIHTGLIEDEYGWLTPVEKKGVEAS